MISIEKRIAGDRSAGAVNRLKMAIAVGAIMQSVVIADTGTLAATNSDVKKPEGTRAGLPVLTPANLIALASQRKLTSAELEMAEKYAQKEPDKPQSHVLLSAIYGQKGFAELANQEIETAWQLAPSDERPLFALIRTYSERSDFESLDRLIQTAASLYKGDEQHLLRTAALLQLFKHYKQAMPLLDDAVVVNSKDPEILAPRMYNLWHVKRTAEAKALSTRLASDPRVEVHGKYVGGLIALSQGDNKKALALLKAAHKLNHESPEILKALLEASLAADSHSDAVESGFEYLARVAGTRAQSPVKKQLAAYLSTKNPQTYLLEAATIGKSMGSSTTAAYYHLAVGDLLDDIDRRDLAIAFYCGGILLEPNYGRAYMRLARDLEATGNYEDALKCYIVAGLLTPNDRETTCAFLRARERQFNKRRDTATKVRDKVFSSSKVGISLPPELYQVLDSRLKHFQPAS